LILGLLLVVGGLAGAGWALRAATGRRRPHDIIGAVVAPFCIVVALIGGVMLFVPHFLR
jgi:hypothetical protein